MDFQYFHIPTKIIQGYESFASLNQLGEISRRRIILVTDSEFGNTGIAQQLRRYIENASYGLIPFDVPSKPTSADLKEGSALVKESRAQTVIGFGNTDVLAFARGMVQLSRDEHFKADYIEIPTLPGIYPGLISTYFITEDYDLIKRPYTDEASRASWLLLDSSYIEHLPVSSILSHTFQGLAYSVEAYLSRKLNFLGESYALRAIETLAKAGSRLVNEPVNTSLKAELLVGGLLASFTLESSTPGISSALGMGLESAALCTEAEGAAAVFTQSLEYILPQSMDKVQKLLPILDIAPKADLLENGFAVLEFFQKLYTQMELRPLSLMDVSTFQMENAARCAARYDFLSHVSRPIGYTDLLQLLKAGAMGKKAYETSLPA